MGHPIAILGVGTEQAGGNGHCEVPTLTSNIGSGTLPGCSGLSDGNSSIFRTGAWLNFSGFGGHQSPGSSLRILTAVRVMPETGSSCFEVATVSNHR